MPERDNYLQVHGLAIENARVIDPETGLDAIRTVGITDGQITCITQDPLIAEKSIDATGLVLAPGFIDLHSHAQTRNGLLLQALDGVTTALDLEMGAASIPAVLSRAEQDGRPINYGYSASWLLSRMSLLDSAVDDDPIPMFSNNQRLLNWKLPASSRDVGRVLEHLELQIEAGAIGIGILAGYAPQTGAAEQFSLARAAAKLHVPTFTHTRFMSTLEPGTALEGALEVISAAAGTGAHMHLCHLNSTSNRMIDEIADAILHAQSLGLNITTETYPYGSGGTVVGADFLAPENLSRMGLTPDRLWYIPTGEWISGDQRLTTLRELDPGGGVFVKWADEDIEEDRALLMRSLLFPESAIASDALPTYLPGGVSLRNEWPVPSSATAHPRSTGCFARTFGWLVRELEVLTLAEAVRKCTLIPAKILEEAVPAMRNKGRIQVGTDADIVIFDPDLFNERSDYHTVAPSVGVRYLLVGGQFVVYHGEIDPLSTAGRPILAGH